MPNTAPTIILADAMAMDMPVGNPKATSLDGQLESIVEIWTSEDGSLETGLWECTPGTFVARRDGYNEVAQILSGRATIKGDDGVVEELAAGSTFVTPAGWTGTWIVHETMRKLYVVHNLGN